MDLNKLRYFLVVAETEHVTRAANMLGISQPALTRAIHRLEEELGVTLIAGEGRNIRLTEEGLFLKQQAAQAMRTLDEAEHAVKIFSTQWQQTIDLCIESASAIVTDAIVNYSKKNPHVGFELHQETDERMNDIVIFSSPYSNRSNSYTERIGIVVPYHLCEKLSAEVALEDLRDWGFICLAGNRGFRKQCDLLCKSCGFVPSIVFESDNPSVVRKMIEVGLGVGFWPEYSWGRLRSDEARWLPLVDEGFERTIRIELTSQGIEKPVAREFRAFLLECFSEIWNG